MSAPTIGVIVGNRGFFPDHLCDKGRSTILKVLAEEGINAVALSPDETKFGSVETLDDARKCADLFKRAPRRDRRRARHAAQLRRRARRRQHAALVGPRRAGARSTPSPTTPAR